MVKRVAHLGHNTTQANSFVGLSREITVDITANELRVHDGATAGGHRILNITQADARYMSADSTEIFVDTVNEHTVGNGVNIDGVVIKDGEVDGVDISAFETAYNNLVAALDALDIDGHFTTYDAHVANVANPHGVTKTQVGLANVTNDAQLKIASNLSDLADAGTSRTNLGLGTVATLNVGTAANNIPQLDANARMPAVDSRNLTKEKDGFGCVVNGEGSQVNNSSTKRFRAPFALTLLGPTVGVRANVTTAQTSGTVISVHITVNGSSMFSTDPSIDNNEKTSVTAATPAVFTAAAATYDIPDDAEIIITVTGATGGQGRGLQVAFLGVRT